MKQTTSDKVKIAMESQGRKQNWLAKELGLTPQTISNKLHSNVWSVSEIIALQKLLNIN